MTFPLRKWGPRAYTKHEMNKTELAYCQFLEALKYSKVIVDYRFEGLKLKLANRTFYTPDFFVIYPAHFEIHEVKGWWEDDARVKVKVAAEHFPWFVFRGVKLIKKEWIYEEF